ncbi:MAG: cation diffusion facilitator family transporter [Myxococcota bacterium]|jgi:cation diffusion facilitator family transporter|nr:cation diffusion facilitator family transporter [Myxococcota bacterium]
MTTISKPLGDDEERARRTAALWSLYGGLAVLTGKFAAYFVTESTAVFSDAMESTVNVVAAMFLVYSIRLAATPADRNHPYGHGKIEFFAAGVEGTLIVVAALSILYTAGKDFLFGSRIHTIGVGMGILAVFTLVNAALGRHLVRVGERVGSMALRADGMHIITDVWTTVGVIIGLLAVRLTGLTVLDPIAATIVALNILRIGYSLAREAVGGLMDEANDDLLQSIIDRLEERRADWCIDVHSLRVWRSGALHHVDFHLTVPRYFDADQLHDADDQYKADAFYQDRDDWDVIVHYDPCRPRHCSECKVEPCPIRAEAFKSREPLTLLAATREDESLDEGVPLRSSV